MAEEGIQYGVGATVRSACRASFSSAKSSVSSIKSHVANIFLNSSSVAALAGALAADTSAAGVWRSVLLPPLRGVCTLSVSSVDMSG
ncbi:hypothetical protein DY000_02008532 [Brassica cretica]|uniref:Uncharacterized protein n=1 Tax=Brassica cretica TaxID=69181 RepID=A0ABQ7BY95_BRACR|nr:hypothetical protein DY000_02008532 [Brassica cretica]